MNRALSSSALLALLLFTLAFTTVHGQGAASIALSAPDTSQFPRVSLYFEPYDADGNFVGDLRPEQAQVLEDNQPLPLKLSFIQPGTQVIVAINVSAAFTRSAGSMTQFDAIRQALITWAQSQPAGGPDDYSLSLNTGLHLIRDRDPNRLAEAIAAYEPDLYASQPALTSLTQALDLATDPNPNSRMKRAILYITPPAGQQSVDALPNLAERAAQQGVRLFVWQVGQPAAAAGAQPDPLIEAVQRTGGKMAFLNGADPIPDPNTYLAPMRYQYLAEYTSQARSSGAHTLALQIQRPGFQVQSPAQTFEISLLPPNPIFLSPPITIRRTWNNTDRRNPILEPQSFPFEIMIEFPDGKQRPVKAARLYVDGILAGINIIPPFGKFSLNLEPFTVSGFHTLRAEVEDTLGLTGSTIETEVEFDVEELPLPWYQRLMTPRNLMALGALAVAVLVFATVLSGGRLFLRRRTPAQVRRKNDPVTQPVVVRGDTERRRLSAAETMPTIPRDAGGVLAPARLVRLSDSGHPIPSSSVPLTRVETLMGSDPQQVTCVLDSASVSPLHARLRRELDGTFQITDAGSVAGTWVNYASLSPAGASLHHGDLIFLGRVAFRFELTNPPPQQPPVIKAL